MAFPRKSTWCATYDKTVLAPTQNVKQSIITSSSTFSKYEIIELCSFTHKRKPVLIYQQLIWGMGWGMSSLVLLSFSLVFMARFMVPFHLQEQLKNTNEVLKVVKTCLQCCSRALDVSSIICQKYLLFIIWEAVVVRARIDERSHCPFSPICQWCLLFYICLSFITKSVNVQQDQILKQKPVTEKACAAWMPL